MDHTTHNTQQCGKRVVDLVAFGSIKVQQSFIVPVLEYVHERLSIMHDVHNLYVVMWNYDSTESVYSERVPVFQHTYILILIHISSTQRASK